MASKMFAYSTGHTFVDTYSTSRWFKNTNVASRETEVFLAKKYTVTRGSPISTVGESNLERASLRLPPAT